MTAIPSLFDAPLAKPLTQADQVLVVMQAGHPITPLQALDLCGCFRLGARIFQLRAAGHVIHSRRVTVRRGASVSEYWMDAMDANG